MCWQVPGSGKTLVITHRIRDLIENYHTDPAKILVITFTNAAATEMKERFYKLCTPKEYPVTFGTFHSIYFHILKHTFGFNQTNLITPYEKREYLQECIEEISKTQEEVLEYLETQEAIESLLSEFSICKNQKEPVHEYLPKTLPTHIFSKIFERYESQKKRRNKIDFDDMVLLCYHLLKDNLSVRAKWQQVYTYILVDEFQDANELQYEVLKLLGHPCNNIFAVGDDDQSIYSFRGAKPDIMQTFEQELPNVQIIILTENYRSTENIIKASLSLIGHNQNRYMKNSKGSGVPGSEVVLFTFQNKEEELENIVHFIQNYRKKGSLRDIAVIYRVNREMQFLSEKLVQHNIPFYCKEGIKSIYQHFCVQDVLTYLKFAMGNTNRETFYHIMNRPKRYISRNAVRTGKVDFVQLYQYYKDKPYMIERIQVFESYLHRISSMNPYAAIHCIRKGIGYDEYIKEMAYQKQVSSEEWLFLLDQVQNRAKEFVTIEQWLSYIDSYEKELQKKKQDTIDDAVSLSTIHGSKGLEYSIVIIPDVNEGILPFHKAILPSEIEEERRMFYVAMTRAKHQLLIFSVKETKKSSQTISRFIDEIRTESS